MVEILEGKINTKLQQIPQNASISKINMKIAKI